MTRPQRSHTILFVILRDIVTVLIDEMTPFIGAHMAKAAVNVHAQKLGLADNISDDELELLLGRLEAGLSVFTGRDKAQKLVLQMRSKVVSP